MDTNRREERQTNRRWDGGGERPSLPVLCGFCEPIFPLSYLCAFASLREIFLRLFFAFFAFFCGYRFSPSNHYRSLPRRLLGNGFAQDFREAIHRRVRPRFAQRQRHFRQSRKSGSARLQNSQTAGEADSGAQRYS